MRHHPQVGRPDRRFVDGKLDVDPGVGQEVAGEVLDQQSIGRHVGVEGPDQVVAVFRGVGNVGVPLAAVRLRVAKPVHPVASPALPESWRGQQLLHQALVGRR